MPTTPTTAVIRVETSKPVAFDSPDHLMPWGTARDNSQNLRFNRRLSKWLGRRDLKVLDLGCSGGGFIKSILDQGGLGVGIEGSDFSEKNRRAEWATIPNHLFTADITETFTVYKGDEVLKFDVVTAWEVLEHITEEKLAVVLANVSRHLANGGIFLGSVSPNEEIIEGVTLHQTVQPMHWWVNKMSALGFEHHDWVRGYFNSCWIRGGDNAPGSEHLVLTRKGEAIPNSDAIKLRSKLYPMVDPLLGMVRAAARRVTCRP